MQYVGLAPMANVSPARPKSGSVFQRDIERMIRAARKQKVPVESVGLTADGMVVTLPEAPKTATVSPLDELAAWEREHGEGQSGGRS